MVMKKWKESAMEAEGSSEKFYLKSKTSTKLGLRVLTGLGLWWMTSVSPVADSGGIGGG